MSLALSPAATLGATGFALIAVCYGFARFAFGLFLPRIDADLSLSSTLSGLISGGAFLGYCLAIALSAWLTERIGPRAVAVGAALVAAVGMAGIAAAPSAPWLAGAVMLAGSSTGLASPPLAAAVTAAVKPNRQNATNTIINAGTGAGVVLSGPVALMMGDQWRLAYAGFAVAAVGLAFAAALSLPRGSQAATNNTHGLPSLNGELRRLIAAAFLTGAASTAIWSFGAQLVALRLDWSSAGAGLLWIAIGAAGIAGAGAGHLIARFGMDLVHRVFLAAIAAGMLMIGITGTSAALTLGGGLLFGAAYIMLTGVYLLWGVRALPDRPATGVMIAFLALAVGQTAGAAVFGLLMEHLAANSAVVIFASLAITAALARVEEANPRPCVAGR
ncbi:MULTISPECIES: MFS transporter [Achromobacter]|uniref:MFS transporter n=1 Tax=Achromobacter spanius TaxID=217203 RepID=A0ABY8GLE1_9BURK|nr:MULTISPECIES: MFS transporter [Achromobacter]WAI85156.1 MFS transporter [Achromobacter spanius]WEX95238.1 MFS transporter [Achromobacter sp. SS2-2022]WFP05592.1 MFS transporter [Achromobacter spanius]